MGTPNASIFDESIWVKQLLQKKKYAFAADYIRFTLCTIMGGIYLDSDVEVLKSFNDLLQLPLFYGGRKGWHHRSGPY